MHLKTKSGRPVILPTPDEDSALTAAAADDPDNPVPAPVKHVVASECCHAAFL